MDIWVVSTILYNVAINIHVQSLSDIFSNILGIYLGVELLDHMVTF